MERKEFPDMGWLCLFPGQFLGHFGVLAAGGISLLDRLAQDRDRSQMPTEHNQRIQSTPVGHVDFIPWLWREMGEWFGLRSGPKMQFASFFPLDQGTKVIHFQFLRKIKLPEFLGPFRSFQRFQIGQLIQINLSSTIRNEAPKLYYWFLSSPSWISRPTGKFRFLDTSKKTCWESWGEFPGLFFQKGNKNGGENLIPHAMSRSKSKK